MSPLDAAGNLAAGYSVRHHYGAATCESGSPLTGTTYECATPQSAQAMYDACWAQADPTHAVCLDRPWQHRAVRLQVSGGYDDGNGFHVVHQPWGVRLAGGVRCLRIVAPVHSTHGHGIDYSCRRHRVIGGPVHRHPRTWRARVYRLVHRHGRSRYKPLGLVAVRVAWLARPSRHV